MEYGGLLWTILSKHIFIGKTRQSTKFSWANTNFNGQKPHVFVLSTCFHGQNMLRFNLANIFSWASTTFSWGKMVQHFHGHACKVRFHKQTNSSYSLALPRSLCREERCAINDYWAELINHTCTS